MSVVEYYECDFAPLPLGPEMQAVADAAENRQRVDPLGTSAQLSFNAKRGPK